jgi:hypothetical protein
MAPKVVIRKNEIKPVEEETAPGIIKKSKLGNLATKVETKN